MKTLTEPKTNERELRELDAWIAEHVMGWRLCGHLTSYWKRPDRDDIYFLAECDSDDDMNLEWRPSQNRSNAMLVLEKCLIRHPRIEFYFEDGMYELKDGSLSPGEIREKTLALAICRYAKRRFTY